MQIYYLVYTPESLTYTICRALSECGFQISIWAASPRFGQGTTRYQKKLEATPGVRFVDRDPSRLPESISRLIVQPFPRPEEVMRDVPTLAGRAQAITLISAGDRSRQLRAALRLQWLEARSFGARLRQIDRVLYKDGFRGIDLFAIFRSRQVVGFDVHSQFLENNDLFDAIHARDWDVQTTRPYLANFLGSQDPAQRKAILDSVRHFFRASGGATESPQAGKTMFWYEYTDADRAVLAPTEFVEVLTCSDFTLCPRGYSLVTHRPIEALLRGSIPVLSADELDLYGIDLADGVNCIAAPPQRWPETIERLASFPDGEIARMRANIAAFRDALDYGKIARGICSRLGLDPPPSPQIS